MSFDEWKYVQAQEYCIKVADGTHDSPKRKEEGKPLITSKHIKGKSIDFETAYLISDEDYHKINKRSKVDQWDVLISMIGEYCGYCYVETNAVINYAVKNVGIFKVGDKTRAYWLYYYLNSPAGKETLNSLRSGTSQPYLALGSLRSFPILVPRKKEEMQKIVSILSSLDDKIELNRQTNQTLEAIAQAIFKEWFVDFDFPGATGEMQDSELGQIPNGWKVYKLGEIASISSGKGLKKDQFSESGYEVLGANGRIGFSDNYLFNEELILTGRVGTLGTLQIVKNKVWISDNVLAIKTNNTDHFHFVYFCLKTVNFKNLNRGSTQPLITKTDLSNLLFVLPEKTIVKNFNKVCRSLFDKIYHGNEVNQTLTQIRDTLLPKLMKGEIPITETEKLTTAAL